MFKKIGLLVLLSLPAISMINAEPANADPANESIEQVDANEIVLKKKAKRRRLWLWLGGIMPSIATFFTMRWIIKSYKDNPDRKQLVEGARIMRLISLVIGSLCMDKWIKMDVKRWMLSGAKKEPSTP